MKKTHRKLRNGFRHKTIGKNSDIRNLRSAPRKIYFRLSMKTITQPSSSVDHPEQILDYSLSNNHSYRTLGSDYFIETKYQNIAGSRLVLFNKPLAQQLNFNLPDSDEALEHFILKQFAWFKKDNLSDCSDSPLTKTFFSTRYLDSEKKSSGNALGDGRAIWVGEIINQLESGHLHYLDIVLKGTGTTELAWFNHPRKNHKDGQLSLSEAVHEYIYSAAAKINGITAVNVLAVIELPFYREVSQEKAAIVVRLGNHLRFAHYRYFSDQPTHLKNIFEYGLKRDMGLPLSHLVTHHDVRHYLDAIVIHLAENAAIYFDVHAVHGSPTFGNITSCGGTVDFSTFTFTDAHHSNYSYMADRTNLLGGESGQTEQFFNLFGTLINTLKKSNFEYTAEVMPVEYYLWDYNETIEQTLTRRWLTRLGLSEPEIDLLSSTNKQNFYQIVKIIYELKGKKKIQFKQKKTIMAAFEPRIILSKTADYMDKLSNTPLIWEQLFKVNRHWASYTFTEAKPYIEIYQRSIIAITKELNTSQKQILIWQQRSKAIRLSERNEPGSDFFFDSERFIESKQVLHQINQDNASWNEISQTAETAISKLADQGLTTDPLR